MVSKDEALKMAIKYIENNCYEKNTNAVVAKLKEALAQPAQEPVAWIKQDNYGSPSLVFNGSFKYESSVVLYDNIPLYTHPAPSWQGLKMTEVWEIVSKLESDDDDSYSEGLHIEDFYRAIEQALKEKNHASRN